MIDDEQQKVEGLKRKAAKDNSPPRKLNTYANRSPHGRDWHLDKPARLLHEDWRRDFFELVPVIKTSAVAMTEQHCNRRV